MPDAERLEDSTWFCHKCGTERSVLAMGCACVAECSCWYDQDGERHECPTHELDRAVGLDT